MKIPSLGLLPAIFIFLLTYCSSPVKQDKTLESQNNIELRPKPAAYILDSTEAFDLLHRCEIYAYLFNVDSALMFARECVDRFEDLLKYTRDTLTRVYYADSYFNLGYLYQLKRHNDSAFLYLNKALDICRMYLGEDHLITTKCLIKIGNCYREYGDLLRAKEHYLKAYEIRVRTMDSLNTFLVNINSVMAAYYWNMGDFYNTEIFASREQSLIRRLYDHFVVQNPDIQDAVFYRQFMGTGNRPPVVRNLLLSNIPRMYIKSTLDLTWRYLENGEGEKAAYYAFLTDSLVRKHDPQNTFLLLSVLISKANILLFNGELKEAE